MCIALTAIYLAIDMNQAFVSHAVLPEGRLLYERKTETDNIVKKAKILLLKINYSS